MFAFLRGTVALKAPSNIALDVNGVGYEVLVPESTHRRLGLHQEVTLLTHCHIREDVFQIFGFLKQEEKALFEMLLGVQGIGPKAALSVLSVLSPAAFGKALRENDITALTKAPGVGKKGAQRILLEIKAKLGQDPELSAIIGDPIPDADTPDGDDVYEALLSLGCTPPEARKAALTARKELGTEARDEDLVRAALRTLARTR